MVKIIIFHYVMYCMYFFPVIFSFNDIATTVNDNQTEMDICNEEKTSIFDMRNEETELNEDIGFKSSDESSDEMEFDINEYVTDEEDNSDTNEEDDSDTNEEELDEEIIVDRPFDNDQMPQIFGKFAPYFKNITELLFFFWVEKHHICKLDFLKQKKQKKFNILFTFI